MAFSNRCSFKSHKLGKYYINLVSMPMPTHLVVILKYTYRYTLGKILHQYSKLDTFSLSSIDITQHIKSPGNDIINAMKVKNLFDKYAILKFTSGSTLERDYMDEANIIRFSRVYVINIPI